MDNNEINYLFANNVKKTIYYPQGKQTCSVIRRISKGKLWEARISKQIWEDCEEGTTAIDIGANIGVHTLSMLDKVGEKGNVIAFEPQKKIKECLEKTTSIYNNCDVYDCLVSNKSDNEIFVSDGTGRSRINNGVSYSSRWEKSIKKCEPLDNFKMKNKVSLIKIDVEGHELEVLEGAKNTIEEHKPIIYIEVWDGSENKEKILKWCDENNYNGIRIAKNDYKLVHI